MLSALTAARGSGVRFVIEALSAADGKRVWTHETAAEGALPPVHDKHNLASASPVTDARVYAVFGTGQVVAVDMAGRMVWTRHLGKDFGDWDITWGNGSSPVIHQNALILACYHGPSSYLIALDAVTGKQLWKTDRPRGTTLQHPGDRARRAGPGARRELERRRRSARPGHRPGPLALNEPNQFPIPVAMHHDGVIYLSRGYRSGPYAAIRPGGRGDISKTHVVWHVPTGAPYISSIVYYDG